jgi:uncharacterized integral membrane protein
MFYSRAVTKLCAASFYCIIFRYIHTVCYDLLLKIVMRIRLRIKILTGALILMFIYLFTVVNVKWIEYGFFNWVCFLNLSMLNF